MKTYELTPEQFNELMRGVEKKGYVAMDNATANVDLVSGGHYSTTYIARGEKAALDAVAGSSKGAVANVKSYYNEFSGAPTKYVLTTEDPTIAAKLDKMNIKEKELPSIEKTIDVLQNKEFRGQLNILLDSLKSNPTEWGKILQAPPRELKDTTDAIKNLVDAIRNVGTKDKKGFYVDKPGTGM